MTAPPRQLIVCCDGTNNNLTGRLNDTNVTKLCELLDPDGQQQRLFYDPGVGNPGQLPGTTRLDSIKREVQRLTGLAFGQGIFENIAEGYTFLMQHYQDGDQIYLYGFSRGAFTARSIAGLVAQFGLLRPENQALLPTLLHTYFADRRESQRYRDVTAQVSALFCSPDRREVPVWFVGVWDTVASVGFPMLSQQTITARPSIAGKRYHHVRQALALDEHRRAFEPRPYIIEPGHDYAAHGQSIAQAWFSGSHGDVGGGYPHAEAGLCDDALRWMLQESIACGLRIDPALLNPRGELDDRALAERLALRSLCPRTEGADTAAAPCRQLHSETYDTPWWALAGLKLRDPTLNPDWNRLDDPVQPVEHPSVGQQPLQFAADTSWSRRRALGPLFWALLGLLAFDVLAGLMLAPDRRAGRLQPYRLLGQPARAVQRRRVRQPRPGAVAARLDPLEPPHPVALARPAGSLRHRPGADAPPRPRPAGRRPADHQLRLPARPRHQLGLCPRGPPAPRQLRTEPPAPAQRARQRCRHRRGSRPGREPLHLARPPQRRQRRPARRGVRLRSADERRECVEVGGVGGMRGVGGLGDDGSEAGAMSHCQTTPVFCQETHHAHHHHPR